MNPSVLGKGEYYPLMDWVRYILALAVIVAHINVLAGYQIPFFISSYDAVGGFFALSGFLMYPNYLRHNNCRKYTYQRARRILPPYIFIVVLAALSLSLISVLSFQDYFLSSGLYAYLAANLSFLNWLHADLPGVFQGSQYHLSAVNGSLWTMKVEWCLYFSVPVFIFIINKIRWIKRNWLAITIILLSIGYRLIFNYLYETTGKEIYNILSRQIFGQLSFFYCGMLVYFYKEIFIKNKSIIFAGSLIIYLLINASLINGVIFGPFAVSGMVMIVSLLPSDLKFLRHKINISYEMYLFHFPIIQLSIYLEIASTNAFIESAFVLGASIMLSLISYYAIERPLNRKRLL